MSLRSVFLTALRRPIIYPDLPSAVVNAHLQPDDILAAPAESVTAGCARPSSRFRGIASPAMPPPTRYSTVGLTRGGACLP
ncbi:hypothetical protein FHR07_23945 [Serratia ureilytica]|nr:hypothetical protein [Serratia ureilytica]